jgi:hypothetical protein
MSTTETHVLKRFGGVLYIQSTGKNSSKAFARLVYQGSCSGLNEHAQAHPRHVVSDLGPQNWMCADAMAIVFTLI